MAMKTLRNIILEGIANIDVDEDAINGKIVYSTNDEILDHLFDEDSDGHASELSWIHAWTTNYVYVVNSCKVGFYIDRVMRNPTPENIAEHQGLTIKDLTL